MRPLIFSVILPSLLLVSGLIMILLNFNYGGILIGAGIIWLVVSFLIEYKDNESQPLGMGRGRKR
ncbi:MAG: hypothetical protein IAE90_04790 [Ignavibacteria bacterium]|nr:hypothetical protein [Ignavibacteria bacterium]